MTLSFKKFFFPFSSKETIKGSPETIKISIKNVRALYKENVVMKMQLKGEIGKKKDSIFWLFITGYLRDSLAINVNIFLMAGNAVV